MIVITDNTYSPDHTYSVSYGSPTGIIYVNSSDLRAILKWYALTGKEWLVVRKGFDVKALHTDRMRNFIDGRSNFLELSLALAYVESL